MKKGLGRILGVLFILLVAGMTVCAEDAENIKKNRVFQTNGDVELHETPDAASAITGTLPSATPVIVKEDAKDGWCKVSYQETAGYVQISYLVPLGSQVVPIAPEGQDAAGNGTVPAEGAAQGNEVQDPGAQSAGGEVQSSETQPSAGEVQDPAPATQVSAGEAQDPVFETQPSAGEGQDSVTQDESVNMNSLDEEFRVIQEENQLSLQEAEAAKAREKSDKMWKIIIGVLVVAIFAVGIVTTLAGNKGKKKKQ